MVHIAARSVRFAVVLVLLVAAAIFAWNLDGPPDDDGGGGQDVAEYQRVLKDPHPSADEIIDVTGAPDEVARAPDGSLLLAYYPYDAEGGEEGAAAWRVYDRNGKQVAEHAQADYGAWNVHGVPGGFVFGPGAETAPFFVDTRGHKRALKTESKARAVEKGDVLVSELEPTVAYRPSTGTLAPLVGMPDDSQHVAIDEQGTTWMMPLWGSKSASVVRTPVEGEPERHTFPLPHRVGPHDFAAGGGTAVVPLADDETAPDPRVRALVVTTDRGATWRTVRPPARFQDPSTDVLADGLILIGEAHRGYWLADRDDNRSFHRLDLPADLDEIVPLADTLYGIADGKGMWTSEDQGRSWDRHEG